MRGALKKQHLTENAFIAAAVRMVIKHNVPVQDLGRLKRT
jgi:hypothetical protein